MWEIFRVYDGKSPKHLVSPRLTALALGDSPEAWEALGFAVDGGRVVLGGIALELGARERGISAWSLPAVDGLQTFTPPSGARLDAVHPNGAIGVDHLVVLTPDFDRTAAALDQAGLALRRIRDAGGGVRQGFRRVGPAILELVEARGEDVGAPARFWGLVVIVEDLDGLKGRLGELLSEPKPAVQPGRRIATLSARAELGQAVAFMDPDPGALESADRPGSS